MLVKGKPIRGLEVETPAGSKDRALIGVTVEAPLKLPLRLEAFCTILCKGGAGS